MLNQDALELAVGTELLTDTGKRCTVRAKTYWALPEGNVIHHLIRIPVTMEDGTETIISSCCVEDPMAKKKAKTDPIMKAEPHKPPAKSATPWLSEMQHFVDVDVLYIRTLNAKITAGDIALTAIEDRFELRLPNGEMLTLFDYDSLLHVTAWVSAGKKKTYVNSDDKEGLTAKFNEALALLFPPPPEPTPEPEPVLPTAPAAAVETADDFAEDPDPLAFLAPAHKFKAVPPLTGIWSSKPEEGLAERLGAVLKAHPELMTKTSLPEDPRWDVHCPDGAVLDLGGYGPARKEETESRHDATMLAIVGYTPAPVGKAYPAGSMGSAMPSAAVNSSIKRLLAKYEVRAAPAAAPVAAKAVTPPKTEPKPPATPVAQDEDYFGV